MGILDKIKERNQVAKIRSKAPVSDIDLLIYLVKELTSVAAYEEQDIECILEGYLERFENRNSIINHMQHDRVI